MFAAPEGIDFPFDRSPLRRPRPGPEHMLQCHVPSSVHVEHTVNSSESPSPQPVPEDELDVSSDIPGDSRRCSSAVGRPFAHRILLLRRRIRSQGAVARWPRPSVVTVPDNPELVQVHVGTTKAEFKIEVSINQDLSHPSVVGEGNRILTVGSS